MPPLHPRAHHTFLLALALFTASTLPAQAPTEASITATSAPSR